jgi:hypothetical protein
MAKGQQRGNRELKAAPRLGIALEFRDSNFLERYQSALCLIP